MPASCAVRSMILEDGREGRRKKSEWKRSQLVRKWMCWYRRERHGAELYRLGSRKLREKADSHAEERGICNKGIL